MAKQLKAATITEADLNEYLNSTSDFAFELKILRQLNDMNFKCYHGGGYQDPVTGKTRQFDIRCYLSWQHRSAFLAVECKNLSQSFPLLVSRMPRDESEAFLDLIVTNYFKGGTRAIPRTKLPLYPVDEPVGKSCAQVGRDLKNEIVTDDKEVYEKWSQGLASMQEILRDLWYHFPKREDKIWQLIALPIVVVPNNTLWTVDYDEKGSRVRGPEPCDRCSHFVGKEYKEPDGLFCNISHVEFVTEHGLTSFVETWIAGAGSERLFLDELPRNRD
jgi:hypothetical protein